MTFDARRIGVVAIAVVLATVCPGSADTPAGGDATAAIGFGFGSPPTAARACMGAVAVLPVATVTTFPPAAEAQYVAIARSTCAGNLAAGTWYSGSASFIDIGLWQAGSQVSNTRCIGQDDCSVTFPVGSPAQVYVLADFHWSLASGTWSVQEPGGCVPDGAPIAIRCGASTSTHV